jgi:tetratricopeptide (TPR) repeat protein
MNDQILGIWHGLMEEGTRNLSNDSYEEAENCFSQCVPLAIELIVPEILAFTLRLLATARLRLGKLNTAEKEFKQAAKICIEIQNAKGMAEAWAGLANVAVMRGSLAEAVQWYERSIAIYPVSSPRLRLGMLYSDLGQVYASQNNLEKAEQALIIARKLCQENNYPRGEGELNVLLGEISFRLENCYLAKQYLKDACKIFTVISDYHDLAGSLQYLAFLHYDSGDFRDAVECQQRSAILWLRSGKNEEVSDGLFFLSKIEQGLGDYYAAKEHLAVSIKFYPKKDLGLALRYQALAWIFIQEMNWQKAEEKFREAFELFLEIKDTIRANEAQEILEYLAMAQKMNLNNQAARIQDLAHLVKDGNLTLEAMQKLGRFYENRHNYITALQCYWQALYIARRDNIEVMSIEKSIQRISQKVRKKTTDKKIK